MRRDKHQIMEENREINKLISEYLLSREQSNLDKIFEKIDAPSFDQVLSSAILQANAALERSKKRFGIIQKEPSQHKKYALLALAGLKEHVNIERARREAERKKRKEERRIFEDEEKRRKAAEVEERARLAEEERARREAEGARRDAEIAKDTKPEPQYDSWEGVEKRLEKIFEGKTMVASFAEFKRYCILSYKNHKVFELLRTFVDNSLSTLSENADKVNEFIDLVRENTKGLPHPRKDDLEEIIKQKVLESAGRRRDEERRREAEERNKLMGCVGFIKGLIDDPNDILITRENQGHAEKLLRDLSPEQRTIAEIKIFEYILELKKRKPLTEKIKIFIRDISDNISEKLGIMTERVEIKRTLRKVLEAYDKAPKTQAQANSKRLAAIHNKVGFKPRGRE